MEECKGFSKQELGGLDKQDSAIPLSIMIHRITLFSALRRGELAPLGKHTVQRRIVSKEGECSRERSNNKKNIVKEEREN